MFSYQVCGLGLHSTIPLPELSEGPVGADVEVCPGTLSPLPFDPNGSPVSSFATPSEIYYYWRSVGTFLIRGGSKIIFDPAPAVEEQVLRLFLLGRVLGTLLHQRGHLVLHASAVAIGGSAVAFLGGKGFGKSTTAAALYAEGYAVLSDDIVALDVESMEFPTLYPSFPQLKLWPEAASSLGFVVETLPKLHPEFEKRARQVNRDFSSDPLPLRSIFVLAEGDRLEIETLRDQEAFIELVRHSYAVRLLEPTSTASRHFRQCRRLVDSVTIKRLRRPASLERLTDLTRLVRDDLHNSEIR